jgi:hypothetical protein
MTMRDGYWGQTLSSESVLALLRRLSGPPRLEQIISGLVPFIQLKREICHLSFQPMPRNQSDTLPSKKNTKRILGTLGVCQILEDLAAAGHRISTVGIGGIKLNNVHEVLIESSSLKTNLDGVAVVSGIMAAQDPEKAARELLDTIRYTHSPTRSPKNGSTEKEANSLAAIYPKDTHFKDLTPAVLKAVKKAKPISHNMTNLVCFSPSPDKLVEK